MRSAVLVCIRQQLSFPARYTAGVWLPRYFACVSLSARDHLMLKDVREHLSVVLCHILEQRGRIALDISLGVIA